MLQQQQQHDDVPAEFSPEARNFFGAVSSDYFLWYSEDSPGGYAFRVRKELLLRLLKPKPGALLDVGCGPGVMVHDILQRGYRFSGVDVSEEMIAECNRRFGNVENCQFSQGTAATLLFPPNTFDAVICLGVIDHVPAWEKAIGEMLRVSKPDGDVFVAFPNLYSPWAAWRNFVFYRSLNLIRPAYFKLAGKRVPPALNTTARMFRPGQIERVAATLGGEVVGVHHYNFNVMVSPLDELFPKLTMAVTRRLEALNNGPFRWLGGAFIAHIKKTRSGAAR